MQRMAISATMQHPDATSSGFRPIRSVDCLSDLTDQQLCQRGEGFPFGRRLDIPLHDVAGKQGQGISLSEERSMHGLLQPGPMRIASCRLVGQRVTLQMRDAKDDGDAIRMPGNEMNAAHKKRGLSAGCQQFVY